MEKKDVTPKNNRKIYICYYLQKSKVYIVSSRASGCRQHDLTNSGAEEL